MLIFGIIFVLIGIALFALGGSISGTIMEMYPQYIRLIPVTGLHKPAYFAAWVIFIAGLLLVLMHFLDKPLKNYRKNKERHLYGIGKKLCSHCSFILGINDEFCEKCGAKQKAAVPVIINRFCHFCGKMLGEKASFCKNCGKAVLVNKSDNGIKNKKTALYVFLGVSIFSIMLGSAYTLLNLWDAFVYDGIIFSEITDTSVDSMFAMGYVRILVMFFVNRVIPATIGVFIILCLERFKLIKSSVLKSKNLLVPFVLYIMWFFGDNALFPMVLKYYGGLTLNILDYADFLTSVFNIQNIWFWTCIIIYLLVKSGTLNMTARKLIITLSSLTGLCVFFVLFLTNPGIADVPAEYAAASSDLAKLLYIDKFVICTFMFLFAVYSAEGMIGTVTGVIVIVAQVVMDFMGVLVNSCFGYLEDLLYLSIVLSHIIITLLVCLIAYINFKKKKSVQNSLYRNTNGYY